MSRQTKECFNKVKPPKIKIQKFYSIDDYINEFKNSRIYSFKFWVIVICVIGFIYQLWDATDDYLQYRTVANTQTEFKLETMTTIPAITICSDIFFDKHLISKKLGIESMDNFLKEEKKNQKTIGTNEKRAIKFRSLYKFLEARVENFNLKKAFDYSINFTHFIKQCIINNDSKTEDCHKNEGIDSPSTRFSIQMLDDYKKCETFRTHLIGDSFMNTISDSLTTIGSIDLYLHRQDRHKSKSDAYMDLEITIHSPYDIPHYPDGFIQVKHDYMHTLRYWTTTAILLPHPYDTDCYDYKSDKNLKSKDDCAIKCQNTELKKICKQCIPDLLIIREDLLNGSEKLCKTEQLCNSFDKNSKNCTKDFSCGLENLQDIYFWCFARCKTECHKTEYYFTPIEDIFNEDTDQQNTTLVNIEPKIGPKVTIKYRPSITWTSFVANIGGIGSFWLGLTVLEIYRIGEVLIKHILSKINT